MRKIHKRQGASRVPQEAAPPSVLRAEAAGVIWRSHWPLMAIWVLVFIAYSNSFHGALVFDNGPVIGDDPRIREATPQNIESILTKQYWYGAGAHAGALGLYRPVTTLSYLLNYAVLGNGPRPVGYHVVNLILHEVNVTLVYALGVLIFGEIAPALALAAIWGLHPLLTESVANIVGRADLLACLGVLAGFLCYVRGASSAGRSVVWLAGLAVAQTAGVFSKENAAVLPSIMLLYDLTRPERAAWRRRLPAYAMAALPIVAFFCVRAALQIHMTISFAENPLVNADFWTARLTAIKVVGMFLQLFWWPSHLSADYSYNAIPLSSWDDAQALLALVGCVGAALLAIVLAVSRRRNGMALLFFLGFFFVALLPTSNLVILIGSIMAERFFYLPLVGLAGCAVAAVHALSQRNFLNRPAAKPVGWAALSLVSLAFVARTYARNADWQDSRSLWTSTVDIYPGSARPHYNLGLEYQRTPDTLPQAIAEYQAALRIQPDLAAAHNNLANALTQTGRLEEAIPEYQAAVRIQPDLTEAHYNLANALAYTGRFAEAIAEYHEALRLQPDMAEAHANLGNTLARIPGHLVEAIAEFRAALRLQPDRPEIHFSLANALAQMPDALPEAIAEYEAALRIAPNFAEAHLNLGNTLARVPGRVPEAIAQYEAALRIRPDPRVRQLVDRLSAGRR